MPRDRCSDVSGQTGRRRQIHRDEEVPPGSPAEDGSFCRMRAEDEELRCPAGW